MPNPTTTQTNPTNMATTYSEAKDLRKGEELMIFIGTEPIAYTTSHTLDTAVDTG